MKVGLCVYSGYKIYPGHGKTLVKADGKVFTFLNSKCERSHLMKRNSRKVTWTMLYRRKHKKGQEEETTKKRVRRINRGQKAIVGASLTEILAKRNMKPEVRKAQREQAIKVAKEKKASTKKPPPPPVQKKAPKSKMLKQSKAQAKGAAPRVAVKR